MELEQKVNIKPDKFSPESTLKIGNTKISLLKENAYVIESSSLLLDSINENMTHDGEHRKKNNMSIISDAPRKTTKKTKKALYEKIKMKFKNKTKQDN